MAYVAFLLALIFSAAHATNIFFVPLKVPAAMFSGI